MPVAVAGPVLRFIPARAGNTRFARRRGQLGRFIPARAGNTRRAPLRRPHLPVHPRPRGGTRVAALRFIPVFRFIPARAGNTAWRTPCTAHRAVHPRPRGEHVRFNVRNEVMTGFIPARAGNTSPRRFTRSGRPVHPRPRGEHAAVSELSANVVGSSPPARGTRRALLRLQVVERFIPARAGNTQVLPSSTRHSSVHPRPRGEHIDGAEAELRSIGSSPPARGTPARRVLARFNHRFIPARAGNTTSTRCGTAATSVHPRPRGEHGH